MNRLIKDLTIDRANNPDAALLDKWEQEEDEDEMGADGELDVDFRDPSKFTPFSLRVVPRIDNL